MVQVGGKQIGLYQKRRRSSLKPTRGSDVENHLMLRRLQHLGLRARYPERYGRTERWTGILRQNLGLDYDVIEEGLNGRTTVWDDPIEGIRTAKSN